MLANGWFFCQTQLFLSCGLSPLSLLPLPLSTTQLSNKCLQDGFLHTVLVTLHTSVSCLCLTSFQKGDIEHFFICTNLFIQDMAND